MSSFFGREQKDNKLGALNHSPTPSVIYKKMYQILAIFLPTLWTLFDERSLLSDQGGLFIKK